MLDIISRFMQCQSVEYEIADESQEGGKSIEPAYISKIQPEEGVWAASIQLIDLDLLIIDI
jgi:hypothetical protein